MRATPNNLLPSEFYGSSSTKISTAYYVLYTLDPVASYPFACNHVLPFSLCMCAELDVVILIITNSWCVRPHYQADEDGVAK